MKTKIISSLIFFSSSLICLAQQTAFQCDFDVRHNQLMQTDPVYKKEFLEREAAIKTIIQNQANSKMQTPVFTIPIVYHIKHLGEPIGQGTNFSDAAVQSALKDLNDIFRNKNGLGVDCEISFCLAVRDPYGNPTSGIERSTSDMAFWPSSSYFNVFVRPTGLTQGGGFSIWLTAPNSTLGHETGHAFSLGHTYLNNGSSETSCIDQGDRVCDTPPDDINDGGCSTGGCLNIGNYMSHCSTPTDKQRFTQGQKDKMRAAILYNSSILSSLGCVPVTVTDAAIEEFTYPIKSTYGAKCTAPYSIAPVVKLKNIGDNTLTSVIFKYKLDNNTLNSFLWNGSLSKNSWADVTLPSIPITKGAHTILAYSINPNGITDDNVYNDSANISFTYNTTPPPFSLSASVANGPCAGINGSATATPIPAAVEISEGFEASTDWTIVNGSQPNKWHIGTATANGGSKSIYVSNNNNSNLYDINTSSIIHFYKDFNFPSNATNITIKFDWKGVGEAGMDFMEVFLAPTSVNPIAGYYFNSGKIGKLQYNLQNSFATETITGLDANAGTTKRLVFCWRNYTGGGTQAPAAIDNIVVSYNTPSAPYSYSWNTIPVQTTATATNLSNGAYIITVSDANTCTKTALVIITQPAVISIKISQVNVSCNGGNNGSAKATASGGTGALSYSWNTIPVQITATASNLSAATYVVTVTDANSCTKTATVTITQPTIPSPVYVTAVYGDTRTFNGETLNQRAVVRLCDGSLSGQISLKAYLSANNVLDASDVLADQKTIHALNPSDTARVNYYCTVPSNWPVMQKIYVISTIENASGIVLTKWVQPTGFDNCIYDVNGSGGSADFIDIGMVVDGFNGGYATPSALKWNSSLDVVKNNLIDFNDIGAVSSSFNGLPGYACLAGGSASKLLSETEQEGIQDEILIYPNPSSGMFNVQWFQASAPSGMANVDTSSISHQPVSIEIYNVFGEKVYLSELLTPNSQLIDISLQPSGVYFVKVNAGNGLHTTKIIIQK